MYHRDLSEETIQRMTNGYVMINKGFDYQSAYEFIKRGLYKGALCEKLCHDYDEEGGRPLELMCEKIINDTDFMFFPNIEEFINDKPLSPIEYRDMTIEDMMYIDIDFGKKFNFIQALRIMNKFVKAGPNVSHDYYLLCTRFG